MARRVWSRRRSGRRTGHHGRASLAGGALIVALAATGCAGGSDTPDGSATTTSTGQPTQEATTDPPLTDLDGCLTAADATLVRVDGALTKSDVAILGDGPTGVIISYENHGTVCPWLPLADRLVAAGHTVVLYDRRVGDASDYPIDLTTFLRDRGIEDVTLLGGSLGGMASVQAATTIDPPVEAVVALSGADASTVAYGPALRVPLLQVVEQADSGFAQAVPELDRAAVNSPDHQLMLLNGDAHASAIFDTTDSAAVMDRIVAFVDTYAGS